MIYDLLSHYKKNTSTYNRVFRYTKPHFYLFIISIISIPAINIYFIYNNFNIQLLFLVIMFSLISSIILNGRAKKIISKRYHVSVKGIMWKSPEVINKLYEVDKKDILDYLRTIDTSLTKEDIERLVQLTVEESEDSKGRFPIIPSIFAALFISICNNYFSWLYRNINSLETATNVLFYISLLLIMIIGIYIMLKTMLDIGYDLISDNNKLKKLSKILDDIIYDVEKGKMRLLLLDKE